MAKAGKVGGLLRKAVHKFIRSHVEARLVKEAGFSPEKAEELVSEITEKDIEAKMSEKKITVVGEGGLLSWLKEHQGQILSVITALFALLSLFGKTGDTVPE